MLQTTHQQDTRPGKIVETESSDDEFEDSFQKLDEQPKWILEEYKLK